MKYLFFASTIFSLMFTIVGMDNQDAAIQLHRQLKKAIRNKNVQEAQKLFLAGAGLSFINEKGQRESVLERTTPSTYLPSRGMFGISFEAKHNREFNDKIRQLYEKAQSQLRSENQKNGLLIN